MKTIFTITHWLLVLTPALWLAWDPVAYLVGGNPATESANIDVYAYHWPWISLFWGYLTGHFFAQRRLPSTVSMGVPFFKRWDSIAALLFALVWAVWDLARYPSWLTQMVQKIPGPGHGAIVVVTIGTLIGYEVFQMDDETLPNNGGANG